MVAKKLLAAAPVLPYVGVAGTGLPYVRFGEGQVPRRRIHGPVLDAVVEHRGERGR